MLTDSANGKIALGHCCRIAKRPVLVEV